jgi:hypothetical protein
MKRFFIAATLAAAALSSAPASAQISVNIGQPGFYGRIDIGGFAPPPLLYPQPVMIQSVPVSRPPIYLNVPPSHARDWRKHCQRYNACGERVYFVQNNWYEQEYAPRYQEHYSHREHDGYRDNYRREERRDYREEYRGEDRGRGRGEDHDHGHGRGRERD